MQNTLHKLPINNHFTCSGATAQSIKLSEEANWKEVVQRKKRRTVTPTKKRGRLMKISLNDCANCACREDNQFANDKKRLGRKVLVLGNNEAATTQWGFINQTLCTFSFLWILFLSSPSSSSWLCEHPQKECELRRKLLNQQHEEPAGAIQVANVCQFIYWASSRRLPKAKFATGKGRTIMGFI